MLRSQALDIVHCGRVPAHAHDGFGGLSVTPGHLQLAAEAPNLHLQLLTVLVRVTELISDPLDGDGRMRRRGALGALPLETVHNLLG